MPKSTATCNKLLDLVLNGIAWTDIAENDASSPLTSLYLSLHSADPGVGNSQLTNEVAYTNYVRIPISRVAFAGFLAASSGQAVNAALLQFAQCGVTGATATHVAIGTASSGAGNVLYAGALNSSLPIANTIRPQFSAAALTVTES